MQAKSYFGISLTLALVATGCSSDDGAGANPAGSTGGAPLGGAGGAGTGGIGAGGMGAGGAPQGGQTGACSPKEGPQWSDLQPTATKLYESDNIIDTQVVDGGKYYFFERSKGIQRMPEQGGTPELLVTVPQGVNTAGLFVLSASYLYWTQFDSTSMGPTDLRRVPREQWTATPEILGAPLHAGLNTADDDALYGYDQTKNELWKQDFKTGAVTVLASNVDITAMSLVGGYVYFADNTFGGENISRVAIAGGTKERMVNGRSSSLSGMGVFGDHIYWDSGGSIYDTTIGDPSSAKEIGHPGPGPFSYATVEQFALRGQRLYFIDDGVNVAWIGLDGSGCGSVLSGIIVDAVFGTNDLFVSIFDFPNSLWRTPL